MHLQTPEQPAGRRQCTCEHEKIQCHRLDRGWSWHYIACISVGHDGILQGSLVMMSHMCCVGTTGSQELVAQYTMSGKIVAQWPVLLIVSRLSNCVGSVTKFKCSCIRRWSRCMTVLFIRVRVKTIKVWWVWNTCKIIPVSKWLVTPIYKPFRPLIEGITKFRGLTNHGY